MPHSNHESHLNHESILADGVAETPEFEHVRTMFESDRASASLGIRITELDATQARGEMIIQDWMCNGHGSIQGGFIFAFADATFAGACNAAGQITVAAQVGIHYISPAFAGETLHAHAVNVAQWGRNGITDVRVTCGDRLVALFHGTSRTIPSKPIRD